MNRLNSSTPVRRENDRKKLDPPTHTVSECTSHPFNIGISHFFLSHGLCFELACQLTKRQVSTRLLPNAQNDQIPEKTVP
jgi:hypothetical protein